MSLSGSRCSFRKGSSTRLLIFLGLVRQLPWTLALSSCSTRSERLSRQRFELCQQLIGNSFESFGSWFNYKFSQGVRFSSRSEWTRPWDTPRIEQQLNDVPVTAAAFGTHLFNQWGDGNYIFLYDGSIADPFIGTLAGYTRGFLAIQRFLQIRLNYRRLDYVNLVHLHLVATNSSLLPRIKFFVVESVDAREPSLVRTQDHVNFVCCATPGYTLWQV